MARFGTLTAAALLLAIVHGAHANLLCSAGDKLCQTPLGDNSFYEKQKPGQFKYDFFAKNATTIKSNLAPNSGIKVTAYTMAEIPMSQLPAFNFATLWWWMPPASTSSPHTHANAVESGAVIKGYCYVCLFDMSSGTAGVAKTPQTAPYSYICNRVNKGEIYFVPSGWLHFLFFPCEDTQLVFSFNNVDYQTINFPRVLETPFPKDKWTPGPGVTKAEMQDINDWMIAATKDYVYGDSHLLMGSKSGAKKFCKKWN